MPNRRQRRAMAKAAGYFKMKQRASPAERAEMLRRAAEVGRQIHLANVERNLRANEEKIQKAEQDRINRLVEDGHTPEEALKIFQEENDRRNS